MQSNSSSMNNMGINSLTIWSMPRKPHVIKHSVKTVILSLSTSRHFLSRVCVSTHSFYCTHKGRETKRWLLPPPPLLLFLPFSPSTLPCSVLFLSLYNFFFFLVNSLGRKRPNVPLPVTDMIRSPIKVLTNCLSLLCSPHMHSCFTHTST